MRQRFHGYRRALPEQYLTGALTGHNGHFALVAEVAGESIVALASYVAAAGDVADFAVLVQDSCQRQGIGSALLGMLIAHADHRGIGTLRATVLAEQEWIVSLISAYGSCSAAVSMGVYDVTLHREKGNPAWIG